MNKESIIELQRIDCNCNDCKFMQRDLNKKKVQDLLVEKWQKEEWDKRIEEELSLAMIMRDKVEIERIRKQVFKPAKSFISYGFCRAKDFIEVSFLPNISQIETQECFMHRRA